MKTIQERNPNGSLFEKLLTWFDEHSRSLPFRETREAYSIWLSEIIMQQTRMEQGLPYYLRFKQRFPDVQSLAKAKEEEVLKLWQGLGYYSRGRNLLQAARAVEEQYGGIFPTKYQELIQLKGIGPYTAAAIASMAGNEAVAVVDGNVQRILSRFFAIEIPVNETQGQKLIQHKAKEFLNPKYPGKHNEAMMELGALICTPRNPQCKECPLQLGCKGNEQNLQHLLPLKTSKTPVVETHYFYVYLATPEGIVMRKRTEQGIWKHLYETPHMVLEGPYDHSVTQEQIMNCFDTWGIHIGEFTQNSVYQLKHRLTHRLINATMVHIETLTSPSLSNSELFVASLRQINEELAITRLQSRFQELIDQSH